MGSLSWVINFANSVVGVGVLAMPYCFYQCGILLASLMILSAATLTKCTCEFLLRSASYTRRTTFEQIAYHIYGRLGKLVTEISIIGLLLGTLVAFQVVIGDLAPAIIHNTFGLQESWTLRTVIMIASCGLIIPISLMRNVSSLASLNAISMTFYMFFIFVIVCFALPSIYLKDWWNKVNFWNFSAFFQCLPIISIAFTCQAQVLVMYSALPDPNMKVMTEIINKAINLVAGIYITVGTFGYISFFQDGIHGDILENFPHGFFTDGIKFGFWLSVILSFPLIVFPVRAAINSLLFANKRQGVLHDVISSASDYIAPDQFTYITVGLVSGTLVLGILIPNIETVLSITGALVGTFLCFVFPSALFLMSGAKDHMKRLAQFILVASTIAMVLSTMSVLSGVQHNQPRPAHKVHDAAPAIQQVGGDDDHLNNAALDAVVKATDAVKNRGNVEEIKNKGVHQFDHVKDKNDVNVAVQQVDTSAPKLSPDQNYDDAKPLEPQVKENASRVEKKPIVENDQDTHADKNENLGKTDLKIADSKSHEIVNRDVENSLNQKLDVPAENIANKVQIRHQLSNGEKTEEITKKDSVNSFNNEVLKTDELKVTEEEHISEIKSPLNDTLKNGGDTEIILGANDAGKNNEVSNDNEVLKKKELNNSKLSEDSLVTKEIIERSPTELEKKDNLNTSKVMDRKPRPGRDILSS